MGESVSEDPAGWPGGDRLSRCLSNSTMGAEVFHGRVRDGIGCINLAMTTGPPGRILTGRMLVSGIWMCVLGSEARVVRGLVLRAVPSCDGVAFWCDGSSIGRLGPLGCIGYPTSTCGLSTCWSGTALEGDLV